MLNFALGERVVLYCFLRCKYCIIFSSYASNKLKMIEIKNREALIQESLKKSMSYHSFTELVEQLSENKSTTGDEKSEALINYTMLNDRRLKRWNKTLKISNEIQEKISNYNKKITWLVLTESWCGDAAHIMPAMHKISELNTNIDLKVVLRDENKSLMNTVLTDGNQSIPKLIMIETETGEVLNTFGPRPSKAKDLVAAYKEKHGKLTPEFKEDLQKWYNKDKGQNTIKDLVSLLV